MLTKIAFTLAVVIGVLWFARRSRQRVVNNPAPVVNQGGGFPIGWLATGVVALMIIAGGWLMYDHWEKSSEMVFVRVVDSGTQKVTEYRAYRGDIEERAFVTVDNVSVTLAGTERLETSTKPLDQN